MTYKLLGETVGVKERVIQGDGENTPDFIEGELTDPIPVAGGFVPGVPMRDLTDEEAERYGVTEHPLWEKVAEAPPKKKGGETADDATKEG